jgi:hypothetical protein
MRAGRWCRTGGEGVPYLRRIACNGAMGVVARRGLLESQLVWPILA